MNGRAQDVAKRTPIHSSTVILASFGKAIRSDLARCASGAETKWIIKTCAAGRWWANDVHRCCGRRANARRVHDGHRDEHRDCLLRVPNEQGTLESSARTDGEDDM